MIGVGAIRGLASSVMLAKKYLDLHLTVVAAAETRLPTFSVGWFEGCNPVTSVSERLSEYVPPQVDLPFE